jgi:hypothetical protein
MWDVHFHFSRAAFLFVDGEDRAKRVGRLGDRDLQPWILALKLWADGKKQLRRVDLLPFSTSSSRSSSSTSNFPSTH